MDRWIIDTVPTWVTALSMILGTTGAAIGIQRLLRRIDPVLATGKHNEVAGFLVAVIGVMYAVIVGFVVVALWEDHTKASETVNAEAAELAELDRGSEAFGPVVHQQVRAESIAYGLAVIQSWPGLGMGHPTRAGEGALEALFGTVTALTPHNPAQQAYFDTTLDRLHELSQLRRERWYDARDGRVSELMWTVVLLASVLVLGFSMLFGLENARLHYVMVAGVAIFVALDVLLVLELSYPFRGDLAVGADGFKAVLYDLVHGV